MRALVRQTSLAPDDFVYPMFFHAGLTEPKPISTMPGIDQLPISAAASQARMLKERGIRSVILFGLPTKKDDRGSTGLDPDGPVPRAIRPAILVAALARRDMARTVHPVPRGLRDKLAVARLAWL